ncbi:Integral membrane protein [Prochlorococcus marinus str. MIT 9321]|uniref:Integral membrane protein n=1 Tax=Prochlorococcus marinus str. MIT 9401 TaxID=167551 RepID=A0A0A2B2U4_PROMR|nr:DMT family transporter [Prochlorococcus marinus]KGG04410.1 Integral membrane protein [Prochlorococcus marinus str. MIT 9322]KGG05136.1 Integral membrane protein [Prochlorococcus marinus str. MIT 9321]KGG07090.1 Integral membrane protein [Prochlorococcus marinus str. MIT 9401]
MINFTELDKKFNSLNKLNLVFASFFFSLMTLCVKNIDNRIPIYELVFFRSLLSLIITLFIINLKNINPLGNNRLLLILRGVLGTIALLCIFHAIRNMPLSISTVIQYTYPIFISIFAGIFISEKITRNLFFALIFGWVGILVILNPTQLLKINVEIGTFSIFIAFLGSICTALAYVSVKKLSYTENVYVIIEYFPLVSFITLSPIVLINWVTPNWNELIWIFGIGLFTQLGQTFLTIGLKNLPASEASAINYLQVLFGSIWGILFFSEVININFLLGASLVLLGTIISTTKIIKRT